MRCIANVVVCLQTVYIASELAGHEDVICRLLDCDTVTQAKEKAVDSLFRNTPFSQRPAVDNVDLGKSHREQDASAAVVTHSMSVYKRPASAFCLCKHLPVFDQNVVFY